MLLQKREPTGQSLEPFLGRIDPLPLSITLEASRTSGMKAGANGVANLSILDGWWIEGDNPFITDDSRKYGEAVVLGRVLFRYWRAPAANQVRDCSVDRRGRSPGR